MEVKGMRSTVGGSLPQERPCKYHSVLISVFTECYTGESRADLNYYVCLHLQYIPSIRYSADIRPRGTFS